MAAPVDAGRQTTGIASNGSTTLTLNLPASIAANDILVMLLNTNALGQTSWTTWTQLDYNAGINTTGLTVGIYYKVATGSEGTTDTNFVVDNTTNKVTSLCWRITGGDTGTAPAFSTMAHNATTTPDPGNCVPAGGSNDYLWLWASGQTGTSTMPPTGNPTNYSNPFGVASGGTGSANSKSTSCGASRQNTASSEDPGGWTLSTNTSWAAYTIAVYPAPPAPPATPGTPNDPIRALAWLGA